MSRRFTPFLLLLAALTVFGVVVGVVLYNFFVPRNEWVQVGARSDFPVDSSPYRLADPYAFIVHLEDEWIALSGRPPNPRYQDTCLIDWDSTRNRFAEPCGGAFFALDGRYLGGPSPSGMDRYALEIRGDEIWLETTRVIPGEPVPTAEADPPVPVTPP